MTKRLVQRSKRAHAGKMPRKGVRRFPAPPSAAGSASGIPAIPRRWARGILRRALSGLPGGYLSDYSRVILLPHASDVSSGPIRPREDARVIDLARHRPGGQMGGADIVR